MRLLLVVSAGVRLRCACAAWVISAGRGSELAESAEGGGEGFGPWPLLWCAQGGFAGAVDEPGGHGDESGAHGSCDDEFIVDDVAEGGGPADWGSPLIVEAS